MTDTPDTLGMSDDRPPVYVDDGLVVYRASSVGMCSEALLALRMGMSAMMPPDWLLERYREGDLAEPVILSAVEERYTSEVVGRQDEFEVPVMNNVIIRGHIDGLVEMIDEPWYVVEAKKLGATLWEKWQKGTQAFFASMPYYADQLTLYMEHYQLPALYAVGEWSDEDGGIVSVEIKEITDPPSDISVIKAKIMKVEMALKRGDPPRCEGGQWPCPVYYMHTDSRTSPEDLVAHELEQIAQQYDEARAMEKQGRELKQEAHDKLLTILANHSLEKVGVSGYKLSRYPHTSRWLDRKKIEEAGLDPDEFMSEKVTEKVRVTRRGG